MTARSAAEIRADLADCDRDGLPWPSAARRLLADIEPLLARLEAVKALRETAAGFHTYETRDVGDAYLAEAVDEFLAALDSVLAARESPSRDTRRSPRLIPNRVADRRTGRCGRSHHTPETEPDGPWVAPDDFHADVHALDWAEQNGDEK